MSRPQVLNPRWESVAACMVWPDPIYDEQVGKIGEIITNRRGQRAVERLRIQLRDPEGSLQPAFTIIDHNGDRIITRDELRKAINNGMVYPNHIRDNDFEELLLILDPAHTNWIKCGDFLELFGGNVRSSIGEKVDLVTARSGKAGKTYTLLELDERLRQNIKPQTQNLLKDFAFHDLHNTGRVNKQHVKYVLKKNCFPITDLQFEGLWKIFPLCGPHDMKYLEFMEEYGDLSTMADEIFETSQSSARNIKSGFEQTVAVPFNEGGFDTSRITSSTKQFSREKFETSKAITSPPQLGTAKLEVSRLPSSATHVSGCDVLLKKVVEGKWRDILHRCRLDDPRRTGRVNARTLREVLMQCGLPINNKEMTDLLEIKYGMIEGTKLNYWSFIRKCVGAIAELSRCSLPEELVQGDALPRRVQININRRRHPGYRTMGSIRSQIIGGWKKLKCLFHQVDPDCTGFVHPGEFRRILEQILLFLTDKQFCNILKYYGCNLTGNFPYEQFLKFYSDNE